MRVHALALAAALAALPSTASAAGDLPMSQEEFKLWREYVNALEDARVKKMPEGQRMGAIARNFKVPEKKLKEAVDKGEQHGGAIAKLAEESLRAALADAEFASRIKEVRVDATAPHVVTYLSWASGGEAPEALDRQICLAAVRGQKAAPITSTFKVEVVDSAEPSRKLFEGIIAADSAARINEGRIVDFASTRYLKLFEKVKRAP